MASIDAAVCAARLKRLMASWSDNAQVWGGATALLVGSGANKEDDLRYLKSVALEIWLFGYELPDTLVLITKAGELHVVTGGKKAKLVETVVETVAADAGVKVVVHNKPKGGERRGAGG
jgi:nucleosome binding factor SPN SPT16 subunit